MKKILKLIGAIIIIVLAVLVANTLRLSSKQVAANTLESVTLPNDVYQNLAKINIAVREGKLSKEQELVKAFNYAKKYKKNIHLLYVTGDL